MGIGDRFSLTPPSFPIIVRAIRGDRRRAAGFKSEWAGGLVGIAHRPLHGRGGVERRMNARREPGSVKDDEIPPQILVVEDEVMQKSLLPACSAKRAPL